MSNQQAVKELDDLLQDAGVGLKVHVDALAATVAPIVIYSNFNFTHWALRGPLNKSDKPNIMTRPQTWRPEQKLPNRPTRDAWCGIEIGYEFFGTDPDVVQANVGIVATALAQTIDGFRDWSDAHSRVILDLEDPLEFTFGDFDGPATSGFLCRIQVLERSSQ